MDENIKKVNFNGKKKEIKMVVMTICIVLIGLTLWNMSVYTVSEQEKAVVLTAGKYSSTKGAGMNFKIPFLQQVRKVNMTNRGLEMGYSSDYDGEPQSQESLMITKDFNIVAVDYYVEWKVVDPVKYLYNANNSEIIIKNVLQSSARDTVSLHTVDSVLTDGKAEIQGRVKELVNETLDNYDIGVLVTNVMIQDAEPPSEEVKVAFKSVEDAKQAKETLVNEANKYSNEVIPKARAEADQIIKKAEAFKESRIQEATGQAARFETIFTEYITNPDVSRARMYYETMEEILPELEVYIESGDNNMLKILDIDGGER